MIDHVIFKCVLPGVAQDFNISSYTLRAIAVYSVVERYKGKYFKMIWAVQLGLIHESSLRRYRETLRANGMLSKTWIDGQRYFYFSLDANIIKHRIIDDMRKYKRDISNKHRITDYISPKTKELLKSKNLL